jgi:hypothetical protein
VVEQPIMKPLGHLGGGVVDDDMDVEILVDRLIDQVQEPFKVTVAPPLDQLSGSARL